MALLCRLNLSLLCLVALCGFDRRAARSEKDDHKEGLKSSLLAGLKHTRSVSGSNTARRGMCETAVQTTKRVKSILSLVKNARLKSKRRVKAVTAFRSVLENPGTVLESVQTSLQELRRILNSVERHQESERLQNIAKKFKVWHNAVLKVVRRLRGVDTQDADRWLQTVSLNFTQQIEVYEKIRMGVCNFSNEDGENRDPHALTIATNWFKHEMIELDKSWEINEELLRNVSRGALNLNSVTYGIAKTNEKLSKFRNKFEVTKVMNRWFRRMKYLLDEHSDHSRQLYHILAVHVGGNWIVAVEKSDYRRFLAGMAASDRRKLETIMHHLLESIKTLEKETEDLQTFIYDSYHDSMTNDENETRPPGSMSTLDLTDELQESIREFSKRAKSISSAESLSSRLLSKLYEVMD